MSSFKSIIKQFTYIKNNMAGTSLFLSVFLSICASYLFNWLELFVYPGTANFLNFFREEEAMRQKQNLRGFWEGYMWNLQWQNYWRPAKMTRLIRWNFQNYSLAVISKVYTCFLVGLVCSYNIVPSR